MRFSASATKSAGTSTTAEAPVVRALELIVAQVGGATTVEQVVDQALSSVCREFSWSYGSYWVRDVEAGVLRFSREVGSVDASFAEVTARSTFAHGVGLAGRAWKERTVLFAADLGQVSDCVRAPVAQKAGVKSGVCLPIVVDGDVVATIDFFATETIEFTEPIRRGLTTVANLVGQSLERLTEAQRSRESAADSNAMADVLAALAISDTEESAYDIALDTVRDAFGWAYGSVWKVGHDAALHFARESGSVNPEFAEITAQATFLEGVGLSGRAWKRRELVFVSDLAEVKDCVRAPAAQRAGVKSGVCIPIIVEGSVAATIDFFATTRLTLSPSRERALRTIAEIVGQTLTRLRNVEVLRHNGRELTLSISEMAASAARASTVAGEAVSNADNARGAISRLSTTSRDVGDLAKVISTIASQTNLLALNATIEAARAGTAGRGFAVVATEVKELALGTAKATQDVEGKISAIQDAAAAVEIDVSQIADVITVIRDMQVQIAAVLEEQSTIAQRFTA